MPRKCPAISPPHYGRDPLWALARLYREALSMNRDLQATGRGRPVTFPNPLDEARVTLIVARARRRAP